MIIHDYFFKYIGDSMFDVYLANEYTSKDSIPFDCVNTFNVLLYIDNPKRPFWESVNPNTCKYINLSESERLKVLFSHINITRTMPYFSVRVTCTNEFGTSEKTYSNCSLRIGENGDMYFTKMVSSEKGEIEKSLKEIHAPGDIDSQMSFQVLKWKLQDEYYY